MAEQRRKRPGESTFGIIMLVVALVLAWQSYGISGFSALSSPGAFPMAVSAVMVITAAIVVFGDLKRKREVEGPAIVKMRGFAADITPTVIVIFTGFVLAYAALLNTLGFLPTSFVFLFISIQFLYRRSVISSFVIALGALIVIYAVFRLVFQVVLPEGIVPEREIMAWVENLFSGNGEPQ